MSVNHPSTTSNAPNANSTVEELAKLDLDNLNKNYKPSIQDDMGMLWHLRLNHSSTKYLEAAKRFIPQLKNVKFSNRIRDCQDCHLANTKCRPHNQQRHTSSVPFAVLHSDLLGPIKPKNFRNSAQYIVTFLCEYTKYGFSYAIPNKTQVHIAFETCLSEVASIVGKRNSTVRLHTDGGTEYKTSDMKKILEKFNIQHTFSEPKLPQHNGTSERFGQEVIRRIRVNLVSAKMPASYWGHAMNHINFVRNRMPHAALNFDSPFKLAHGREPDLSFVKRFGCLAYMVNKGLRRKPDPSAVAMYLMECSDKGYLLFNERERTFAKSSDVSFVETYVYGDKVIWDVNDESELTVESHDENMGVDESAFSCYLEPNNFDEAMQGSHRDHWEHSIRQELDALCNQGTWDYIPKTDLTPKTKVINTRWVFRRKTEVDNSHRYKSRLVAKGFADNNEYDLGEIYAPVARLADIRIMLSYATKYKMSLHQLDVTCAFLNGDIEKDVYISVPQGVVELLDVPKDINKTHVCKLRKALYGLKVSPNLWNKKFNEILAKFDFKQYDYQKCIYSWTNGNSRMHLIIYVDDCLLLADNDNVAHNFINKLKEEIEIKYLGAPKRFLGLDITRAKDRSWLFVNQQRMINEKVKAFEPYLSKNVRNSQIPMSPDAVSLIKQCNDDSEPYACPYRQAIGTLIYLQNGTRPDVSFAVNFLARKQTCPKLEDWLEVTRIFLYLKTTASLGLLFTANKGNSLVGFSDASLGTNDIRGLSTTGYIIRLHGDLVSWKSVKQSHISLSSCEAEYVALCETTKEAIAVQHLMHFITGESSIPKLVCDSTGAIGVAKTDNSKSLKHITRLCYMYVKDLYKHKKIEIKWVPTGEQIADIMTKPLPRQKFEAFRNVLMANLPIQ